MGAKVGLYQVDKNISMNVYSSDIGYIVPLGLTTDQHGFYGVPVGCAPGFDRFWLISTDGGEIKKELPTSDATPNESGTGAAALSPDSRHLAFTTSSTVDAENSVIRHRLSIYDLDTITIERYDLPHPPSHVRSLLWSSDSQWLYFVLNPGTPFDEPSNSYGLWSLNMQTGQYLRITDLDDPLMRLVSISPDGQWILLQPEAWQIVTYVHLSTAEKIFINLPPAGVIHIAP
jgi:Tol biopolymer transport system component